MKGFLKTMFYETVDDVFFWLALVAVFVIDDTAGKILAFFVCTVFFITARISSEFRKHRMLLSIEKMKEKQNEES